MIKSFERYLTELNHLSDAFDSKGVDFVSSLLNQHVLVSIKVDSAAFVVMNDNGKLRFFGRNGAQEIDVIKRAGLDFYEKAIEHIETRQWQKLPSGVKFFFEMFNSALNPIIKYATKPRNDLIMLFAKEDGEMLRPDDPSVTRAATLLDVGHPPIIFSGNLDNDQKDQINDFISASKEDRARVFGGKSFQMLVLSLFTTPPEYSYLINNGLEGIVLFFGDKRNSVAFKIVDPKYTETINDKSGMSLDYTMALYNIIWKSAVSNAVSILSSSRFKFVTLDESDHVFIDFVAELTARTIANQGGQLNHALGSYAEYAKKYKFSGLNPKFVPSSVMSLSTRFFYADDIFRTFLFNLRQSKDRLNPRKGITPTIKNTINEIVDLLKAKEIVK